MAGAIPSQLGSKNFGGVANVVWSLSKALSAQNKSCAILALEKYFGPSKVVEGVTIIGFEFNSVAFRKTIYTICKNLKPLLNRPGPNILKLCYSIYRLHSVIDKVEFDCLHIHHIVNQMPLAAEMVGLEKPIMVTMHGLDDNFWSAPKSIQKKIIINNNEQIAFADTVTWVSESYRKQAKEYGITSISRESVIHNGIDIDYDQITTTQNKGAMLFVGQLSKSKGVGVLIEALERHEVHFTKCVWAGEGNAEEMLQLHEFTKSGKFELTGYLDKDQLTSKINEASLLVVPSFSETFGLVYLEALAFGLPVIGYAPVLDEMSKVLQLSGEENQFLLRFNPNTENPEQLAILINKSLNNSTLNNLDLKRSISMKVKKAFNWQSISSLYLGEYENLFR
jgi:glycosyltransferase involved in cell wall biosynthesis